MPDMIAVGLAFLEGFALIISPCILPILPIVLSGSLTGSKSRPLGIIAGFIITFTIFTLFSKILIEFTQVSPDIIRNVSFIILIFLGIMMMSSYLTEKFNLLTQRLANVGNNIATLNDPQSGFWGGLIFGSLIGLIWTPCAGPILAAVIVQVVIQQTTFNSVLTVFAFALGASFPMLLIALVGRRILDKFGFLRSHTSLFRKLLGLIIILSVIYLMLSDSVIGSTSSPESLIVKENAAKSLIKGLDQPYPAPKIEGIEAWINSPPLQINELRGKVVLIDFWTYSCINCIRTLPYLKDWYAKYHDKGFVIIGVHSPEFAFEQDLSNVKNAVVKDGILYPVALDNKFVTWQNFHNNYWPAHYLINKEGEVVYQHFGEGEYDVTENNIQYLLGVTNDMTQVKNSSIDAMQTPETYLGYDRAYHYAMQSIEKDHPANYSYPSQLGADNWALNGKWIVNADKIVAAERGAAIKLRFHASHVYAVMGAAKEVTVTIRLNDKLLTEYRGKEVTNSQIKVAANQLYTLLDFPKATEGIVELIPDEAGLEIYTFTFG